MKNIEPKLYIENLKHIYKPTRLNNDEYSKAIQSLIVVCTDVCIIDTSSKTIYLAKRKSRPAMRWWWFIGGRSYMGETERQSMQRCFKRETGLLIDEKRFNFVCMNRYLFKDRQQTPQKVGCDSLAYTFSLQLSAEELNMIKLNNDEYIDSKLKAFNQKEIINSKKVSDPIKDFYAKIFS